MGFHRQFGSWLVGFVALGGFLLALAYAAAHAVAPTEGYYVAWTTALVCVALMVTLVVRAQKGHGPALEWSLPEPDITADVEAIADLPGNWLTIAYILVYVTAVPVVILGYYPVLGALAVILTLLLILGRRF
ncbi:MAG: hypothetical protein K9H25_12025 [Rhodospirillum sp.]|nr:hypothetical protein [Rhodospirillum sp.]MCF8489979.1 hypothetical protein [Rhodospirillum sp.]